MSRNNRKNPKTNNKKPQKPKPQTQNIWENIEMKHVYFCAHLVSSKSKAGVFPGTHINLVPSAAHD